MLSLAPRLRSFLSGHFPAADVDCAVGYGTDSGRVMRHDCQSMSIHSISSFNGEGIAGRRDARKFRDSGPSIL